MAASPALSPGCREQFPEHHEAAQIFKLRPSALPSVCQTPPGWALSQISTSSHLNQISPPPAQAADEDKSRDVLKKSKCPWPFHVTASIRNFGGL